MDLFERARSRTSGDAGQGGGANRDEARAPAREETIEGMVERIVFAGGDGDFTVARFKPRAGGEVVTIVGSLPGVPVGASLRVVGKFEHTVRFGAQLRVASYTEVAPATLDGIRRYLGSGLIKGIGPEFAGRIVARFGITTLEVLDRDPGRISEVTGIGPTRARSIRDAWAGQREVRKVMVFLQGYGVSPAFAARIYRRYGAAAIARVRENPYRLAFDVWGIGFLSADKLATALGIERESAVRIDAGVRHVLEESAGKGDVFVPRERLAREAAGLLGVTEAMSDEAIDRLARAGEAAIDARIAGRGLDSGGAAIYETGLYQAEVAAAAGLRRLLAAPPPPIRLDADRALAWYEKEAHITLASQQAEAVRRALTGKVVVITGGPGVGKTTIIRGVVSILTRKGLRVALAAPTGRAAKRLSEATGAPASTLHRLLEWRPAEGHFGRNADRPLEVDLLVVDESSMLDVRLAADLVGALPSSACLCLVGDVDQLPSVGPGTVLRDVIASGVVPVVRLTEIFRQAAQSLIVRNAHRIHEGEMPELGPVPGAGAGAGAGSGAGTGTGGAADARDFFFMEEDDPARAAALIRDLVTVRLPRRYGLDPHEIQVLSPMHRGDLGAANINLLLQETLTAGAPALTRGARTFRTGDKVMQIRNDYDKEVWNGDIGRVVEADAAAQSLLVRFDDRDIEYDLEEIDQLTLAYAATVHKSQGSEYPAVVIPVHTQHYMMLQRNLLYTAVTRGKRLVVLVGSRKALGMAVRNAEIALRCSGLAERLRAA